MEIPAARATINFHVEHGELASCDKSKNSRITTRAIIRYEK